jgi:hypothetical protein
MAAVQRTLTAGMASTVVAAAAAQCRSVTTSVQHGVRQLFTAVIQELALVEQQQLQLLAPQRVVVLRSTVKHCCASSCVHAVQHIDSNAAAAAASTAAVVVVLPMLRLAVALKA